MRRRVREGEGRRVREGRERVRDSVLGYEGGGRDVISHLVDGQDPIAHQLCLGGDKRGEHETRTITQHQSVTDVQRLEEREGWVRRG